jgi:spore germination protein GerM
VKRTTIAIVILALAAAAALFLVSFFAPSPHEDKNQVQTQTQKGTREIFLYYYSPEIDRDAAGNVMCSRTGLVRVKRQIAVTPTPIQDAINLLLKGELTDTEKATGLTTEFPLAGLELKGANLANGGLTLEFSDPQNKTNGGSCRAAVLWFQIEATAKQFNGVNEVKFIPEALFQP